jgi:hypothetical protein
LRGFRFFRPGPGLGTAATCGRFPGSETFPRAGNRKSLFIEELADTEEQFDIARPVRPLAATALGRDQCREFGFPIAKDVRGHSDYFADFTNLVIELFRDKRHTSQTDFRYLDGLKMIAFLPGTTMLSLV